MSLPTFASIASLRRRRSAFFTTLTALAAAVLAACSPVKVLDRLVPSDTYQFQGGIAYGQAPRQVLDVYQPLPATRPARGARPLVVIPDYGLSPAFTYPVFVRDSALAVKWALDNAAQLGADPKQVYVMGHSSGGYNAAMVALDDRWLAEVGASPRQLAGWIGLAGPYDFLPIGDPQAQAAFNWPNTPPDSQPLAHVTPAAPRALLMAAAKDNLVYPDRNTGQMAAALRAAGVPVQVRLFDNLSHVTLIGAFARPIQWLGGPVLPPVMEFLGLASVPSDKAPR
jgi:acetyl esterase/lipase